MKKDKYPLLDSYLGMGWIRTDASGFYWMSNLIGFDTPLGAKGQEARIEARLARDTSRSN